MLIPFGKGLQALWASPFGKGILCVCDSLAMLVQEITHSIQQGVEVPPPFSVPNWVDIHPLLLAFLADVTIVVKNGPHIVSFQDLCFATHPSLLPGEADFLHQVFILEWPQFLSHLLLSFIATPGHHPDFAASLSELFQ